MAIAIVGAGSWGTALSLLVAHNTNDIILCCRNEKEREELESARENLRYLPGHPFPEFLKIFALGSSELEKVEKYIIAVPSGAVRAVAKVLPNPNAECFLASKGLEPDTAKLLHVVIQEERPLAIVGAISGPNLATEVARGVPTATLVASPNEVAAREMCELLKTRHFRAYFAEDILGVEIAGALKNVLAIGAGVADGLGYGDNTKGALLARGLREVAVLGLQMGAQINTFFGIAGVGDLFATANSKLSRNYRVGYGIGQGRSVDEMLAELGQVAEGINTSKAVAKIAKEQGIDMPIHAAIGAVIEGKMKASDAVALLMERETTRESIPSRNEQSS